VGGILAGDLLGLRALAGDGDKVPPVKMLAPGIVAQLVAVRFGAVAPG
jgi:hypothetical protein